MDVLSLIGVILAFVAIIGGNYLTTFGRPIEKDRDAIDRAMDSPRNLPITPVGQKQRTDHGILYSTLKSL